MFLMKFFCLCKVCWMVIKFVFLFMVKWVVVKCIWCWAVRAKSVGWFWGLWNKFLFYNFCLSLKVWKCLLLLYCLRFIMKIFEICLCCCWVWRLSIRLSTTTTEIFAWRICAKLRFFLWWRLSYWCNKLMLFVL